MSDGGHGRCSSKMYAYRRVGNSWQETGKFVPTLNNNEIRFGLNIELHGNLTPICRASTSSNPFLAEILERVGSQWQRPVTVPLPPGTQFQATAVCTTSGDDLLAAVDGTLRLYRRSGNSWLYVGALTQTRSAIGSTHLSARRDTLIVGSETALDLFYRSSQGWQLRSGIPLPAQAEGYSASVDVGNVYVGTPQATGAISEMTDSGQVTVYEIMPFDGGFE